MRNNNDPKDKKLDNQEFHYEDFRDSILKDSGVDIPTFERYRNAVITHEAGPGNDDPYSTIQILTDDNKKRIKDVYDLDVGPGRGGYQFEAPSLVTAANRALQAIDKKHPYYNILKDISSKKIKDATQLHPDIQDILFVAQHTKSLKKADGSYYVKPSNLLKNIDTLEGAADVWYRLHNQGSDPSKKKKFIKDVKPLYDVDVSKSKVEELLDDISDKELENLVESVETLASEKNAPPFWKKLLDDIKTALNPKNLGVPDYTDKYPNKDVAFAAARRAGEEAYLYDNVRYTTNYAGTPQQQLRETGITDDRLGVKSSRSDKAYNRIKPSSYDDRSTKQHLKNYFASRNRFTNAKEIIELENQISNLGLKIRHKENAGENVRSDLSRLAELEKELEDLFSPHNRINSTRFVGEDDPYSEDAWRIYLGKPQEKNTFGISEYKPSVSKDENINYYSLPNEFKDDLYGVLKKLNYEIPDGSFEEYYLPDVGNTMDSRGRVLGNFTVDEGEDERGRYISYYDKYDLNPDLPYVGTKYGLDAFVGKPFEIYDRIYLKNYGYGPERMYYTDEELSKLDPNKKDFDTLALQRELYNRGYELPESTKKDGTFDGTWGDETEEALLDYQNSQKDSPNVGTPGSSLDINSRSKKDNYNYEGGDSVAPPSFSIPDGHYNFNDKPSSIIPSEPIVGSDEPNSHSRKEIRERRRKDRRANRAIRQGNREARRRRRKRGRDCEGGKCFFF